MSSLKVVCIGGGTGLSTMLRGLKNHTEYLTAVVTVSDNGGSSGLLRRDLNILPPGDIRNCLAALSETEPLFESLLQHRFSSGALKGHSLGNLFIAGIADMTGSFAAAVEMAHSVLRVKGKVLPVTLADVQLKALFQDGTEVVGECEIVEANKVQRKIIKTMSLIPERPVAYRQVTAAIAEADIIVLGPGSLYTSIIPNLLVDGVAHAIANAGGQVVYISNIMTQPGETDGYTLLEHVQVIEEYLGKGVIDHIVANDGWPDTEVLEHYNDDGAELVLPLVDDARITAVPMLALDRRYGYVRHNAQVLSETIMSLCEGVV